MAKVVPPSIPKELSVGDVATRSGVPVSTLHFYESKGLIKSQRSQGNQRRYAREVLRRMAIIKVAQRMGISLGEIQQALAPLPEGRAPSAGDWAKLSRQWKAELEDRIARLTLLRDRLEGCIGCGCLSMKACPLRNPDDEVAKEGPGPRFLEPD